jgi:GT2 family glycosyltransferase
MKISILIPNYNGAKLLPSCLDSIKKSLKNANIPLPEWPEGNKHSGGGEGSLGVNPLSLSHSRSGRRPACACLRSQADGDSPGVEVLIIDNGSTDNSLKLLEKDYPWVKVISLEKNYGFAKAVNEGIKSSTEELILLINNDLRLKEDFFLCFLEYLSRRSKDSKSHLEGDRKDTKSRPQSGRDFPEVETPPYLFLATRVLTEKGDKIDSCGIEYKFYGKAFKRFNGLPANTPEVLKKSAVLGANASCAIYKREFFDRLGLFDKDFHSYLEDVDISLRAHFKKLRCLYLPDLVSYHKGEATSKQLGLYKAKQDLKNNIFLIINNYPPALILKNLFPIILERLRNLNGYRKQAKNKRGLITGHLLTLAELTLVISVTGLKLFRRSFQAGFQNSRYAAKL